MKTIDLTALCASVLLVAGCAANQDYDISYGVDREIRLFENEISLPLGSTGVFSLNLFMDNVVSFLASLGTDEDFFGTDEKGNIVITEQTDCVQENPYRILALIDDSSTPSKWSTSGSASPVISALASFLYLKMMNQHYILSVNNPLRSAVTVNGNAYVKAYDNDYNTVVDENKTFENIKISGNSKTTILEYAIPNETVTGYCNAGFENVEFTFPMGLGASIGYNYENFALQMTHKCNVAVSKDFNLPFTTDIDAVIPVGKYKLKKLIIKADIENTLPVSVDINRFSVLKEAENGEFAENEDIMPVEGINIAGGSPEKPSVTPVVLTVTSVNGYIPDITRLRLSLTMKGTEGMEDVILNTNQGVSIRNASAILNGGITLLNDGGNKNENE